MMSLLKKGLLSMGGGNPELMSFTLRLIRGVRRCHRNDGGYRQALDQLAVLTQSGPKRRSRKGVSTRA